MIRADVIIAGAGLAGGLTAYRLALRFPKLRILVFEAAERAGGNHTWSFHHSDLESAADLDWLRPMITRTWSSYSVHFPLHERVIASDYSSIQSSQFSSALGDLLRDQLKLGCEVIEISNSHVEVRNRDGKKERFEAPLVIDARGIDLVPSADPDLEMNWSGAECGWQKFVGLDIRLKEPHGLDRAVLMDAQCPQTDGFRFFYCLPWNDRELLVEETFYSTTPSLRVDRIEKSIRSYVERKNWRIDAILRREIGALPLPLKKPDANVSLNLVAEDEDFVNICPVRLSTSAGWFHPTTGYSTADAVRVANFIANCASLRTGPLRAGLERFKHERQRPHDFYLLLNRLLFRAAEPRLRYRVLEKFYTLPEPLIQRFYAGSTQPSDRARILSGKPPVAIKSAMKVMWGRSNKGQSSGETAQTGAQVEAV